jgi:dihydroxyacetone kinase-like protein
MATEIAGGEVRTVLIDDDVAVEASTYSTGRRGVAGTLIVEKMVGAAAESGRDLVALDALGKDVNARTRSMGVALTSCTVPAAGTPTFQIGDGEIEMGVGIHGEPGRRRVPLTPADMIASELVQSILGDLRLKPGSPVLLLVNGFGGTPALELYLMANAARRLLAAAGLTVARSLTGNYVTSLEMAGCSVTITHLNDDLIGLWDAPVHTAALRWAM